MIWGGLNLSLLDISIINTLDICLIKEEPYGSDTVLQILLVAGKRSLNEFRYFYSSGLSVKKLFSRTQPADIQRYYSNELSQRLNARDLSLAWLVGFIEGDGWFSLNKGAGGAATSAEQPKHVALGQGMCPGKYLKYEFGVELEIKDVQLIYKIKELLGVGEVSFRNTEGRSKTVFLRVRKKSHLINVILPIFDKYPLITNKQYDYLRFKDNLLKDAGPVRKGAAPSFPLGSEQPKLVALTKGAGCANAAPVKLYENLEGNYVRPLEPLNSVDSMLTLPYFSPWLIGFIEAEGCFSIYKPSARTSYVASFDISQTNSNEIISAICKYLSFTQKIHKDGTNKFKIKVSSIRSVENVIRFINNAPVKLQGHKKLQYLLWIKELRNIPRYSTKINIPDIY